MITISQHPKGHTVIRYNGQPIATHNLSATTSGTREAFDIPEEEGVYEWLEKHFAEEIANLKYND